MSMSETAAPVSQENLVCRMCQSSGGDVQFTGCGCTLHARCVPLSLIIGEANPNVPIQEGVPPPVKTTAIQCPCCRNGTVGGMYLFPLSLKNLDRAVELRKKCARAAARASSASSTTNVNGKRQRELDDDFHEVQAESSYLLLSHTRTSLTSTMSMDTDLHRTGRWTSEEISFVDFLLGAFDRGTLPLPHGVKLNEFLGDVLLCKSSRLTKKMKNARLSTRSFELRPPMPNSPGLDCAMMSSLQDKFLQSVSSEPTQLELLFNITKLWRTHFSNLCLQVGYNFLEAGDWISSLEAMERRASEAEEAIRKARRKRMGLALKTDVRSSNPGVFFANVPVEGRDATRAPKPQQQTLQQNNGPIQQQPTRQSFTSENEKHSISSDESNEDADFIAHMLELSNQSGPDGQRNRLMSIDMAEGLDEFLGTPSQPHMAQNSSRHTNENGNGSFLQEVIHFLEDNDLPFVHVDIWVPSFLSKNQLDSAGPPGGSDQQQLRLFHAGYATRSDINQSVAVQFNEFGEYSTKFSFAPGVGLPGRVYTEGVPIWSKRVDQADPKLFERAGGARIYGVKTVLSVPLQSSIGKLVVCLYTMTDLDQNDSLVEKCLDELTQYEPEPRWRLVVEMGSKKKNTAGAIGSTTGLGPSNSASPPVNGDFDFSSCFDDNDGLNVDSAVTSSPAPASEDSVREEEQKIATLLGEYMPLAQQGPQRSGGESSSSSTVAPDLLTDLMQLRLLLLRPRARRSSQDNDLLDVLRQSFQGYSSGNRRSGSELATLLVNDWRFLRKNNTSTGGGDSKFPAPKSRTSSVASDNAAHQCHVMDAPNYATYNASGAPVQMPGSYKYGQQPRKNSDGGSVNAQLAQQRRISLNSEVPDSPRSNQPPSMVGEGY